MKIARLRQLHDIGFVYGDVKPSNFCLRTSEQGERKIFLIDLESAIPYHRGDIHVSAQEKMPNVPHTSSYSSIQRHRGQRE